MNIFKKDPRLNLSLGWLFISLCVFIIFRILIFMVYHSVFTSLSSAQIINAFVQGLRFDISVIALFLGPLIFLLNIPLKSKSWVRIISLIMWVVLFALIVCSPDPPPHNNNFIISTPIIIIP